jgi:ferritin-like metal-binding protein YciE
MGLKDSLKRLFSTSKTVGTEKVEQTIEQVKGYTQEKTEKVDEVISQTKEKVKDFARETDEKVKDLGGKIQQKAEETKDHIQAKVDELWENIEDKAVTVVDNLEAKIRGAEPASESNTPVEPIEPKAEEITVKTKKPTENPKS